jgi:hypothetical protein
MSISNDRPSGERHRSLSPHSQGTLDGMCGPYAIANALQLCGVDRGGEIIRIACAAVSRRRWPSIYWDGTTFRDLQRMLLACRHALRIQRVVRIEYPLRDRPARTTKQFWNRFDAAFRDPTTACAIIGITSPGHHWLVVRRDGGRIVVVDSAPRATVYRKNRAGFSVGGSGPQKFRSTWVIERQVLIVVRVLPPPTASNVPIGKNRRPNPRTKKDSGASKMKRRSQILLPCYRQRWSALDRATKASWRRRVDQPFFAMKFAFQVRV